MKGGRNVSGKAHGQIGKGSCAAGYKEGDHFFIENGVMIKPGEPEGICMYALPALLPYLTAYCRETKEDDWINFKQELQCRTTPMRLSSD